MEDKVNSWSVKKKKKEEKAQDLRPAYSTQLGARSESMTSVCFTTLGRNEAAI